MAMHQRVLGAPPGCRTTRGGSRTGVLLMTLAALLTTAGAVLPTARVPSVTVAAGVAGGAGGAELAELAEREVASNGTTSALDQGINRHMAGTIREALGGGVVEVDMGHTSAAGGPPERLRTGGSRCSKPQECIRVEQCPSSDSGVLFECAAGRVCCVPLQVHSPSPNPAEQHQPPPYSPAQQPTQHPAPHLAQQPALQPAHPTPQSRPQPSYQESVKPHQPHPGPQVTPQQAISPQLQQPQRPQVTPHQQPPGQPANPPPLQRPEVTPQPHQPVKPDSQPTQAYHPSPYATTQQPVHQPEAPRPQPPKFTIHLEPQTQRVPTKTSSAPPGPAPAPAPAAPAPTTHRPAEPESINTMTPEPASTDLLPGTSTCGKVGTENRIINGKIASIGQFPWMALLGYRSSANVTFLCGGTLINERYVLTAAHCIRSQNRPIVVRLGEFNLTEPVDCDFNKVCAPPPQDIAIESILSHPEFNIRNIKHDIALVRLSRSVIEYTDYVRPICLPVGLNVTDDKKFKIAGWGKTDFKDAGGSPVLQFTDVNGVGHEECNELQPPELQPLDPGQLCAGGDKGKDACKGDSGGPLMVTLVSEDPALGLGGSTVTYQVGVVSYGPDSPCGTAPLPSIYTRVSEYVPWILDTLRP